MKKAILISCLLAAISHPYTYAQDKEEEPKRKISKTESMFNLSRLALNHHHEADLGNGNKVIVEMFDARDYALLSNTDSLLQLYYKDLAKVSDGIKVPASGNIRVDYLFSAKNNFEALRYKIYPADGEQFTSRGGTFSRLKPEQDTVRLLIGKYTEPNCKGFRRYTPVQLTLLLNNYQELHQVADSGRLQRAINAMSAASANPGGSGNLYEHRTTIFYRPQKGKDSLELRKGLFYNNEVDYSNYWTAGASMLSITGNIGAGLVRDKLSPMAELKIEVARPWGYGGKERTVFSLSVAPYFFFERNTTHANWFLNAMAGSVYNGSLERTRFSSIEVGAGYLVGRSGDIFKGATGKIFANIGLPKNFSICPEIIFTDNMRQVFPGLTLKVFP